MLDLPGPGLEPVSPALAGGLSTTAPPGKPAHPFGLATWGGGRPCGVFTVGVGEARCLGGGDKEL